MGTINIGDHLFQEKSREAYEAALRDVEANGANAGWWSKELVKSMASADANYSAAAKKAGLV